MRCIEAFAVAAALLPASAFAATPPTCAAPAVMADGWPVAAPQKEGLDPRLICAIGPTLEKMKDAVPHAVDIARHGVLVYEHYFTGGDKRGPGEMLGPVHRDADTSQDVQSITKSVTALLAGILVDRGKLNNLDASVFSFLPQYADLRTPEKDHISLRDLLTMTSGLKWREHAAPYHNAANINRRMWDASDPYRFLLAQPLAATPGTTWNYNSGAVDLLGLILQKAAHAPLGRFAGRALFAPLGIAHWQWGNPSWGLTIRPRDLAKVGQLVLNHGVWHGRRIVSARWIKQMAARHIRGWTIFIGGKTYSYGYLWWLGRPLVGNHRVDWVGGVGWGGQRLYVVPSLDLVVAVTAGVYFHSYDEELTGDTALDMAVRAAVF